MNFQVASPNWIHGVTNRGGLVSGGSALEEIPMNLDDLLARQEANDGLLRHLFLAAVSCPSNGLGSDVGKSCTQSLHLFGVDGGESVVEMMNRLLTSVDTNSPVILPDDLFEGPLYDLVADLIIYKLSERNADSTRRESQNEPDTVDKRKVSTVIENLILSLSVDKERILYSHALEICPKPTLCSYGDERNSRNEPFHPKLLSKPHASTPLSITKVRRVVDGDEYELSVKEQYQWMYHYSHPYEEELKAFSYPAVTARELREPCLPPEDRSFHFIDCEADFTSMLSELSTSSEIAIDVETHSYHSFLGFICLIQISTREKNYIIDAIELRKVICRLLDVTSDPNIIKILHNAEPTLLCLQRDFGKSKYNFQVQPRDYSK